MLTTPDILLSSVSMGADITSDSQQLTNMFGFSIQAVYTGSPVGALKLEASLDKVTWNDVEDSSVSITDAGSTLWNVSEVQYPYVRVFYDFTSGSGSLTAKFFGRGF